jgi:hypothetical protein
MLFLIGATGQRAEAAEVEFRFGQREVFLGQSLTIEIAVKDASSVGEVTLPTVDGLRLTRIPGENTIQQFSTVNGRTKQTVTRIVRVTVGTERAGRFVVPPIAVEADGETFRSEPTPVIVSTSETGDLLFADVAVDPPNPFVGQPTKLTLQVWVRPFRDPAKNVALNDGNMWSLIDIDGSSWGVFKQEINVLAQNGRRPIAREELRNDRTYFVYELTRTWIPSRPGAPDVGEIAIRLNWPTGIRIVENFFGNSEAQLAGTRPVKAVASFDAVQARELPSEGRPPSFSGGVGSFTVAARATPTNVTVGDPITLTFTVTTPGDPTALDVVQAPPFATLEALTTDFRIPTDPVAGTVKGRTKTFTQTLRPLSANVTAIPPISFGFFDIAAGTYRTVQSAAIPIQVAAAERLDLSQIVGATVTPSEPGKALTLVAGGLVANVPPNPALLRTERGTLGWLAVAALALPPLAVLVIGVRASLRARRLADPRRLRAERALATASAALRAESSADAALAAIVQYVGDRCGLRDGERTRAGVTAALAAHRVDPGLVERVDATLKRCESARYASAGSAAISRDDALELLADLERCRLQLIGGPGERDPAKP